MKLLKKAPSEPTPPTAKDREGGHRGATGAEKASGEQPTGEQPAGTGGTPPRRSRNQLGLLAGVLGALLLLMMVNNRETAPTSTLADVRKAVTEGDVEKVEVLTGSRSITVTLADGTRLRSGYVDATLEPLLEQLEAADVPVTVKGIPATSTITSLLIGLLPIALLIGAMVWLTKKMPGSAFARFGSRTREAVSIPDTRFADVAGADEAVEELREVVEFLRDGERYERLGARVPRGVLLEGPPGTGKTLLARATAGEAGVPFFALSGSDFVEMFVGVGASRVRSAFQRARENGKAIVFIDEIDAIGKSRGGGAQFGGGNDERENTLNALLVEMDGFERSGVVVIAATNRSDVLDAALLRPGRFDRKVTVTPPDRKGREALFALYLKGAQLAEGVEAGELAERLAARSMGMTGADISAVVNEAALIAAKADAEGIDAGHCADALERVALGRERRSATVSEWAKRVTAWHEAGHTVCALHANGSWKPERVSIVPRGPAGGATWFSTDDEHFVTRSQAFAELVVGLGGRAAEELLLDDDVTQGASGDFMQATMRAERMLFQWGMAGSLVHIQRDRLMGEDALMVRERVEALLQEAMQAARDLLAAHRGELEAIAEALIERETLDRDELTEVVARSTAPAGSAGDATTA